MISFLSPKTKSGTPTTLTPKSGSALISALIFTFLIGISSISYLKMASSEYRASVRATLYSSVLNLAESGVEMAIESLGDGSASGASWKKVDAGFLNDGSFVGDVTVVVLNASSSSPTIYAEGVIKGHPAGDVRKQVKVEVSSGFSPYAKGFSARNGITFSGNNVLLDSYNSKYGPYNAALPLSYVDADGVTQTVPVGYGVNGANKNDDIYVASDTVGDPYATAIDQGNADIFGYVSISPDSTISIGPRGVVTTYDGNGGHDDTRVTRDFYADFPTQSQPSGTYSGSYSTINGPTVVTGSNNPDAPTYYDVSEIALSGNGDELVIQGHAVFVMSGDINISGKGGIFITSDSSLEIYTSDDISISGNGVANTDGIPSDFYVHGTASTTVDGSGEESAGQKIDISGNGVLGAVVYAPAADVSLNGGGNNGSVMGGVVGFTATITGNSSFHFDEALRDEIRGGGVFSIDSWLEMTGETVASTPIDLSAYN